MGRQTIGVAALALDELRIAIRLVFATNSGGANLHDTIMPTAKQMSILTLRKY